MKMMQELERTEELLAKSLKELNDKGELNPTSLDHMGMTLDAIKDLCTIREHDNPSYGRGGMWTAEGSYNGYNGRMIPDMYGRRDGDGDGRYYEGRGYGNRYGNDYRGYGHNEDMVDKLRRDMQNAQSESEREYIRKLLKQYE